MYKKLGGASRYEQIVVMIEESEKLKSSMEGKAERLADKLVPYTFLTTGLTYLFYEKSDEGYFCADGRFFAVHSSFQCQLQCCPQLKRQETVTSM